MERLKGIGMDLVKDRIDVIKNIFPEVFTEGNIDFDKFKLLLGESIDEKEERYEFRWSGKNQAIKITQAPSTNTLRPDKKSSKNWDSTNNIYIEGDNLEVLKLLQKSYFGKVNIIYIDPPYNTGHDFIYEDNFTGNLKDYKELTNQTTKANTESSGRYHTDWLNMMYPRLKLARNLLCDDGLIFISIDNYEIGNLRKLCEEIFGEDNVLQELVWQRHVGGGNDSKYFAVDHEYILVCAKNKSSISKIRVPLSDEDKKDYSGKDEHFDTLGPYKTKDFRRMRADDPRPTLRYTIVAPDGEELYDEWRWEEAKFKEAYKDNKVQIRKGKNGKWIVEYKIYLNSGEEGEVRNKVPRSLLTNIERNSEGKKQLKDSMGKDNIFNNPKPLGLLKYFLEMGSKDDIVLDFFSGSASTANAVMKLNAEDGGSRRFIMVQLPEIIDTKFPAYKVGYRTICDIGKERIRKSGDKIVSESGKTDLDIGFKVFKLDDSNIKEWSPNYDELAMTLEDMTDNLKSGRTKEDLLFEILIKMGIELTAPIEEINVGDKKIYNIGMGSLVICLEDEITEDIIKEIPKYKSDFVDMKVVFKENGFRTDSQKMNAMQNLKQFRIEDVRSV